MTNAAPSRQPLRLDQATIALMRRLWTDWLARYWRLIGLTVLFMMMVAGTTSLYPLMIDEAYSRYDAGDSSVMWLIPVAILVVTSSKAAAHYLQAVLLSRVMLRLQVDFRRAVFDRMVNADLAWITGQPAGAMVSRFGIDIPLITNALQGAAVALIRDALTIAALVGVMIYLDWPCP